MKRYIHYIFTIQVLALVFISGCVEEVEREFPRVKTLPGEIIDNGIILRGEILNYRSLDIEDYGFLLGEGTPDADSDIIEYSVGSNLGSNMFDVELTVGIEEGKTYFYRAYAVSNKIQ